MNLSLRKSIVADLEIFFLNQVDEEANFMAAFTPKNPFDKLAYLSKWLKLIEEPSINMQTILWKNEVIGCVIKYMMDGEAEITYAISKDYWGEGITSLAVQKFLKIESTRPIYGRTAFDNYGSQRILEKAGFKRIGRAEGFANARGVVIEEYIYRIA